MGCGGTGKVIMYTLAGSPEADCSGCPDCHDNPAQGEGISCKECHGLGEKTYGDTAMGRGAGGQMISSFACEKCKGTGKESEG